MTAPIVADPVHPEAQRRDGWSWSEPRHGEHFRRCSWCGSIHPDDLVAEPVWSAGWADRKYGWPHKFYVDVPNRDPSALFVVVSQNHEPRSMAGWHDTEQLTPELEAVMERDGYERGSRYRPRYVQFHNRANHFGKFYTIHLADPQISDETKDAIEQRGGIAFTFADGRVAWANR